MFFIPRFDRFKEKKPSFKPELNWSHPLAGDLFEYNYFDGCGLIDLVEQNVLSVPSDGFNADPDQSWHYTATQYTNTRVLSTNEVTIAVVAAVDTPSVTNKWLYSESATASNPLLGIIIEGAVFRYFIRASASANVVGTAAVTANKFCVAVFACQSSDQRGYFDGIPDGALSVSLSALNTTYSHINGLRDQTTFGTDCDIAAAFKFKKALDDDEAFEIGHNPYGFIKPRRTYWVFSSGDPALSGDAASIAAATGALDTGIPIIGAAVGLSTATGALDTSIDLLGSAASIAVSGGDLTANITLSGAAIASAIATGALDTGGAELAADSQSQASATGILSTSIILSGSAIADALATGDLTADGDGLGGNAASQATGSGDLSTSIDLDGQAVAVVSSTGGLSTQIPLSGLSVSVSNITGDLTASIQLDATAIANATAAGDLTTDISGLSVSAISNALSGGDISTQIKLSGAAVSQAIATATILDPFIPGYSAMSLFGASSKLTVH